MIWLLVIVALYVLADSRNGGDITRVIVVAGVIILLLSLLPDKGHAQSQTYQDSMGRETGRSTTNGNTTTFSDSLGRNTGRAVTNGSTTTIYNPAGQQTGTIRSKR